MSTLKDERLQASRTNVIFPYTIFDRDENKTKKKVEKEMFHENFY